MPTALEFQEELDEIFQKAKQDGLSYVDVNAGELHDKVGGYHRNRNHRMPVCCNVMRQNMKTGDSILSQPPKGDGATLEIRYKIQK